jgi:uncharacterized Zn-finger protein
MTLDEALTVLRNGTLTSINLYNNEIGDEEAKAIADALEEYRGLTPVFPSFSILPIAPSVLMPSSKKRIATFILSNSLIIGISGSDPSFSDPSFSQFFYIIKFFDYRNIGV